MSGLNTSRLDITSSEDRYYVQRGAVELQFISIDEQTTDILTKASGRGKFVPFRDKLGVVRNTFLGKREC